MADISSNNKRIVKNTAFLYVRMIFIMAVSLYTSRIILEALGVEDYGIYNIVGGIVSMFGFINASLSGASSRFIIYSLGEGDKIKSQEIFNSIMTTHYIIAAVVVILAETAGLWFVMNKLVIPDERLTAAFWVYQSTVLSSIIMLVSSPFNALIIAHEKMNAFALISVIEAVLKLFSVFVLFVLPIDRLVIYAILTVTVQVFIRILYTIYCKKHFSESHYHLRFKVDGMKSILMYSAWTMNGNLAIVGSTQGINILFNLFFGPIVNAAYGIALQVQSACNQFCSNFLMAVRPQIIKSYAQDDLSHMHQLILFSTRYSFYLTLLIAVPIISQADYILKIWLVDVPPYTVEFVQFMLVVALNTSLNGSVLIGIHATGDLKKFQMIEGTILLSVVPVSYVLLKYFNVGAIAVFFTYLIIEVITQLIRIWIVFPKIRLAIRYYYTQIMWPIFKVSAVVWIIPYFLKRNLSEGTFSSFIVIVSAAAFSVLLSVVLLGISKNELSFVVEKLKYVLRKK
ncbi:MULTISPECIES: MATE family efflux transporter [Bacteroides]|uniref:lipopolysaccharide biosynthesis protein n=1 Tax=Bacteroides TaxID=816 RepID=UPI000E42E6C0|nr:MULTISPECIES: lipopolysaccharide biosynthesis protein [Bacteroides]RGM46942.1 lipopolysaccharide biosynthesis protein [Bacteroides sp. OM08-11]